LKDWGIDFAGMEAISGDQVREIRVQYLIPLREVAAKSGLCLETVRRFETGKGYKGYGPQLLTAERIRRAVVALAAQHTTTSESAS